MHYHTYNATEIVKREPGDEVAKISLTKGNPRRPRDKRPSRDGGAGGALAPPLLRRMTFFFVFVLVYVDFTLYPG